MTGTYLSSAVLAQLARAQTVIDMHVTFSRLGRCGLCEQPEPCDRREEAQSLFVRYGRLPRRKPGLTFATASRWPVGGWFQTISNEPPSPHEGCGCRRTLIWDVNQGCWRHLSDGTPCVAKGIAGAAE